ncbi:MAG: hypothetical protein M3R03_06585, partial [Pseudomonadota bacterium]|nr:hypothetical protein [Pseudomonadota bacterium]
GDDAGMRSSLGFIAAGAGMVVAAFVLAHWYQQNYGPRERLVLTYQRNTGPEPWPPHDAKNPDEKSETVSHYAVFVARRCNMRGWEVDTNENSTDVDHRARLTVRSKTLSDANFDCLASFVKPPYVTLTRDRI